MACRLKNAGVGIPHGPLGPQDFNSCASASSATPAPRRKYRTSFPSHTCASSLASWSRAAIPDGPSLAQTRVADRSSTAQRPTRAVRQHDLSAQFDVRSTQRRHHASANHSYTTIAALARRSADRPPCAPTNPRTDELTNPRTHEPTNLRTHELTNPRTHELMNLPNLATRPVHKAVTGSRNSRPSERRHILCARSTSNRREPAQSSNTRALVLALIRVCRRAMFKRQPACSRLRHGL